MTSRLKDPDAEPEPEFSLAEYIGNRQSDSENIKPIRYRYYAEGGEAEEGFRR